MYQEPAAISEGKSTHTVRVGTLCVRVCVCVCVCQICQSHTLANIHNYMVKASVASMTASSHLGSDALIYHQWTAV